MRIVVIGGTGLIGRRVVELLRENGHDAVAASPSTGVDTVSGTVRVATSRHRGMPDLIVDGNRLVWDGREYKDLG